MMLSAKAAPGESRTGELHELVGTLARRDGVVLTIEAPRPIGPCTVCIPSPPRQSSSREVAVNLLKGACKTPGLEVLEADGYAHIVSRTGGNILAILDRPIKVKVGGRSLQAFAAELEAELRATLLAFELPLLGVTSNHPDASRITVDVASESLVTGRELLRSLAVIPPDGVQHANPTVSVEWRIVWSLRETTGGSALVLDVVDSTRYPTETGDGFVSIPPEPPRPTKSEWLEQLLERELASGPPVDDSLSQADWEAYVEHLTEGAAAAESEPPDGEITACVLP
jgi:hypothetical protein